MDPVEWDSHDYLRTNWRRDDSGHDGQEGLGSGRIETQVEQVIVTARLDQVDGGLQRAASRLALGVRPRSAWPSPCRPAV